MIPDKITLSLRFSMLLRSTCFTLPLCCSTQFYLFSPCSSLLFSSHPSHPPLPSLLSQFSNSRDVPIVSLRRTTSNTTPGIGGGPRSLLYNSFNKAENNVIVTSDAEVLWRTCYYELFFFIIIFIIHFVISIITVTHLLFWVVLIFVWRICCSELFLLSFLSHTCSYDLFSSHCLIFMTRY